MKSLHIIGSQEMGGAENFYMRFLKALTDNGHSILSVNRINSEIGKECLSNNIPQIQLGMINRFDFISKSRIKKLIKANDPCIVQTYMTRATQLTKFPKNLSSVHIARLGGFYKIDNNYRHAHAWVGNTKAICDYLISQGLPSQKIFHIGNFVPERCYFSEPERKVRLSKLNIHSDSWVFFAMGRFVAKKGFQDLISALALLPSKISGRPWKILIAGDGDCSAELKRQSVNAGLSDNVVWLGWQNPVDPWIDICDLMIVPSRHEPLGNVILEAWNYSKPILSTSSHGAIELISDELNGLLSPCNDPSSMANKLIYFLSMSESSRQELGAVGNAKLMNDYSKDSVLSAYLSLYESLLKSA